jgi:hypothetical protein
MPELGHSGREIEQLVDDRQPSESGQSKEEPRHEAPPPAAVIVAWRVTNLPYWCSVKKLAKLLLGTSAFASLFVFLITVGGQSVGRATGLRVLNYIPPNLIPPEEIVCVVVQESEQASDLFQLPN